MKKISLLFCALCACVLSMHADYATIGGISYNLYQDGDQFLASVVALQEEPNYYKGDIVIPSSVDYDGQTYTVTKIGNEAFREDSITSIVLPSTIKELEASAFAFCKQLTSVTLPEGLENIDDDVFWYCDALPSLTLPSTLKSVGYYAFEYCMSLKTITIPNSVEKMGGWVCLGDSLDEPVYNNKFFVFLPHNYAENYTIPDGIEVVCEASCFDNKSLKSVTIPSSVKTIGDQAFSDCDSLTSVTLSEGLETIGNWAFVATSIISLHLPASLTSLAASSLPGSIETITVAEGNENFYVSGGCLLRKDNHALVFAPKGATLPEGVTEIGDYAFKDRADLTTLVVPSTVTKIGAYAFCDCSQLTSITLPEGLTEIGDYAFLNCMSLKSITLPSTLSNLNEAEGLFQGCRKLESATILSQPQYLPSYFFRECDSLKSFDLPESVQSYGGTAFYSAGFTSPVFNSHLFARLPREYKGAYTIPDDITVIGPYAFYQCDSLTDVTIPSSVRKIDNEAFWDCRSLTRIELPEGVDSLISYAFENCKNVETLILPSTITYIDYYAFSFYTESKLKEVYNYATTPYVFDGGKEPFYDVPNKDQIKLYVPEGSVDAYKAADVWKEFDVQPMSNVPTAISNVQSDKVQCTKTLRNGQLLIEKNGQIYTVDGRLVR
ncbi:MAG: leucine-rich repeat domain-containing protein [Paludibacteraceae bacterium]|nr:leucine-rich repeat domain-containing protein [Paludibacteraceae bacterium]